MLVKMKNSVQVAHSILYVFFAIALCSCSVVVGNVKPVDEKSTQYGVLDLSTGSPDWIKLDPAKTDQYGDSKSTDVISTEISDVAYQSKDTASIISIDSACRNANSQSQADLKTLTDMLFLGITDVTLREERGVELEKNPALKTTLSGKLNGEPIMFQTVVMKRGGCVYDFVYMARPKFFAKHEDDFAHFVASLRLK